MAVVRGRCAEHAGEREHERNVSRASSKQIYNSKRWGIVRRSKLTTTPICEKCDDRLAAEVDHVVPIAEGGDPYAWANLSALCKPCHSRKTRREQGRGQ